MALAFISFSRGENLYRNYLTWWKGGDQSGLSLEEFSIVEDYNSLSNPDNDDDHFFRVNVIYAASCVVQ